jgi:hypothetical protein
MLPHRVVIAPLNWRAILLIFISFFFAIGCSEDETPVEVEPPPDISGAVAVHEQLGEDAVRRYDELLGTQTPPDARAQLIAELDTTLGVSSVGLGEDGTTIWWDVEDGFTHLFYTQSNLDLSGSLTREFVERDGFLDTSEKTLMGAPHKSAALSLSPYKWELSNHGIADHLQTLCAQLNSYNYSCTYKAKNAESDKTILLDDYRNWNNYGIVNLFTHGGASGGQVHFTTGVLVRDVPSRYNDDFIQGNLLPANYLSSPDVVAAVTPGWFTKYYGQGLNKTLVYMAGCSLRKNSSLSSVIVGQGSAFFAWDNPVGPNQASTTGTDLFTQLLTNERDCGEAYQQLVQNGNAQVEDPPANFGFDGDSGLHLFAPWEIVSTNPVNGAANVPVTTLIAAAFSTDIDPSTVNTATFKVSPRVTGLVGYENQTAGFFLSSNLAWSTTYTATITTGVRDLAGNSLNWDYSWSLTTAAKPGENCVDVRQGPWTFCVEDDWGNCILEFSGGNLTQTRCFLSYDEDAIFAGQLTGRRWEGENPVQQIAFYGDFYGTPAESFEGVIMTTDGSGVTSPLTGHYGSSARTGGVAGGETKSSFGVMVRDPASIWIELEKRRNSQ